MRYFSYTWPVEDDNPVTETFSEDDIRREYWPFWYEKMCQKYGKNHVDETYTFEDCLEDWIDVHWAQEVTE